ncbi:amidohydrolase family-domain-containing protein [Flammula alnicola]|nr:amidohydrolase family-domain-containing protein [Flammula alnicola]
MVAALVLSFVAYHLSWHEQGLPETYALCSEEGKKIYTVDEDNASVECLLIQGSRIVDSGDLTAIKERSNSTAGMTSVPVRYAPKGSIIIPGMSDSHCHILEYGASRLIPLSAGKTVKETVAFVREYIQGNSDLERNKSRVIEGWGWDHASWDIAKMPTWADLEADPVVAGRPVILQSRDGHAIWVSRRTLEENAPFPNAIEGGIIIRDGEGNPTGVFMDNAQDLIARPIMTDDDLERRFRISVESALAVGLTSLHDAGLNPESLAFFKRRVNHRGPLPLRIYGMTYFDEHGQYWGDKIKPFAAAADERLSARSIKIFADGALRTGGAALYEPYSDDPSTNGAMRISADVLKKVVPRFLKDGWQVNVHAIGDRANGIVLDAFEVALEGVNVSTLRPRLEHAQIMTEEDRRRLGKLGVIASIQPTHAISDMWFAQDRLGPERVKNLYAFRGLINSGARITLGSDFPVEEINPLKGFYAAITRLSTDGTSPSGPGGWFPDQRLTRMEALRGMTIDPAYASFTETNLGSLIPGKRADFVILSDDIMSIPADRIMETKVLATALDGRVMFGTL